MDKKVSRLPINGRIFFTEFEIINPKYSQSGKWEVSGLLQGHTWARVCSKGINCYDTEDEALAAKGAFIVLYC